MAHSIQQNPDQPAALLRVAVPSPLYKTFDYLAPATTEPILPGMRVQVPFGRSRLIGMVVACPPSSPVDPALLRPVLQVLDSTPVLPEELLSLLVWAQRYYHHPPGEVFATALPVLLRQGRAARVEQPGWWQLTAAGQAAHQAPPGRAPRQQALLAALAAEPAGLPASQLPGSGVTLRSLRDKGWISELSGPAMPPVPDEHGPCLNSDQQQAVTAIGAAAGFQAFLLDGVTGSGKTEVYLQAIRAVLAQGRQALILVPEIGLTPQLLARFRERLPGPLAVLHSGLTDRERLNAWLQAGSGHAQVVIGTRSAIFAPLARPGLIVVDEEHDGSFKQQEGFRYHARDLAVVRANRLGIPVVLGSATPSLESIHNVHRQRYTRLSLPHRVGDATEPRLHLLDVRRQPMAEGISNLLAERMRKHLDQQEQVLLFLNRRGFAPTLICHECGHVVGCSRCDARFTLHTQGRRRLICHHCGFEERVPPTCTECGAADLRALGQGTERIEQFLQEHFPTDGIARIDRDSTRRKGSLESLLEEIHSGQRHILLGTQMLAKGHHFPAVTLVGIIDADQGLFGADFRASERMAQLILQVAGRAGRAERPGVVLIQTHHPDHPLLRLLVSRGYTAFADATLHERQETQLPPFSHQALLRAEADDAELPQQFLSQCRDAGMGFTAEVELLGPVPAPMERRAGRYRAQLLVQSGERRQLHGFLEGWLPLINGLKIARKLRWSLDVDPADLL